MEAKATLLKADSESHWCLLAEHNGVNLSQSWGHQALVISEAILIATITLPEPAMMSTAPDSLFSMIAFAAVFVMLSKWNVLEHAGEQMPGSSDAILARTIERLSLVACSRDHHAAKCARLIETGVMSFKRKMEKTAMERKEYSKPLVQHFTTSTTAPKGAEGPSRSASVSSGMGTGAYATGSPVTGVHTGGNIPPGPMDSQHLFANFPMHDSNYIMGSDIFFDHDFWSSFMLNSIDGNGMSMMGG